MLAGRGHLAAALLLPLYYLADATITLLRRCARGERITQAHRSHFYQRATARGFSVPAVVRMVFATNVVLAALAALSIWAASVAVDIALLDLRRRFGGDAASRDGAWPGTNQTMTRVLVTGASGFVGRALVPALVAAGYAVRAAVRRLPARFDPAVEAAAHGDLDDAVDWRPLLAGIDAVVHLAGIAHTGPGAAQARYDRVNHRATADLAAASARRPGSSIWC